MMQRLKYYAAFSALRFNSFAWRLWGFSERVNRRAFERWHDSLGRD